MTKYAKIKENGTLEYAPRNKDGVSNWIEDIDAVMKEGFLPLIEVEYPNDGKQYEAHYAVVGGKIKQTWQEVEQAYDGSWYIKGYAPVQPIEEQNEAIRQTREQLYSSQIDPLHARKARKVILNDWREADEAEYIAEVARLSVQIEDENPYIEEDNSDSVLSGEPENMA